MLPWFEFEQMRDYSFSDERAGDEKKVWFVVIQQSFSNNHTKSVCTVIATTTQPELWKNLLNEKVIFDNGIFLDYRVSSYW